MGLKCFIYSLHKKVFLSQLPAKFLNRNNRLFSKLNKYYISTNTDQENQYDMPSTEEPIHDIVRNSLGFYEPGKKLSHKIKHNETTNVLLLSSFRSGGAFLGQLLNGIFPDTFYAFDPLFLASLYKVSLRFSVMYMLAIVFKI